MDDRRELRVSEFYNSACETKSRLMSLIHDENRYTVLYSVIRDMADALVNRSKDIKERIEKALNERYLDLWFEFEWQKPAQVRDDLLCFSRFLDYLGDVTVLEANRSVSCEIGDIRLCSRVDLVTKGKGGAVSAYIIFPKSANKSPGGKSVHTSTKTDLYALTAKSALEETYPGVAVNLVYLFNNSDTSGNIGPFIATTTRKSNIFTNTFKDFYEDGVFDRDGLNALILNTLNVKVEADCYNCPHGDLCARNTVTNVSKAVAKDLVAPKDPGYVLPVFTKEQEMVINHKDGPMLVCAPPGSGKTATLVGRVKHLIDAGISPEFILAITFTRDAAGELLNRCKSFCESDSMPEISTIHSLALRILTSNPTLLGKEVRVLSQFERFKIIETLLKECDRIEGLNYSQTKGKNGLYAVTARYLDSYFSDTSTFLKEKGLKEDFVAFAETYRLTLSSHGLVGYDSLVPMAISLMEKEPKVLDGLSSRFKYIMVDEYQDVDLDQVRFIYMLSRHKNLVVVGDDDQSIYGFRGGSNRYMLEFNRHFPESVQVVFTTNFRSTDELVRSSERFIRKNKNRIQKEVRGNNRKGIAPEVISGQDVNELEDCVKRLVSEGYKYSEMAVLATKNATLEGLFREVSFPSVLGKSYLTDNAMFLIVLDILSLFFNGLKDSTLVHLLSILGVSPDFSSYPDVFTGDFKGTGDNTYMALRFINRCLKVLARESSSMYFSDFVFQSFKMDNTAVQSAFEQMVSSYHAKDTKTLYEIMRYMAEAGDETRIEPDTTDKVLFITSHESKGMEWKVVILIDDFKDEKSEEINRLYYVAMTRAKDRLLILTKDGRTLLEQPV